jgi:hypothetical protein
MIKFVYEAQPYEWGDLHRKDREPTVVFTMELREDPSLYGDGTGMMDYVKRFLQACGYPIAGTFIDYDEDKEVVMLKADVDALYARIDEIDNAGDDGK